MIFLNMYMYKFERNLYDAVQKRMSSLMVGFSGRLTLYLCFRDSLTSTFPAWSSFRVECHVLQGSHLSLEKEASETFFTSTSTYSVNIKYTKYIKYII